jgi:ectoine hydroxylase-related dioxygenase (phytanoyl-CoA dioxygenase family)
VRADQDRQALIDDGVVVIRGLLDSDWCARLCQAIERCRRAPSEHYAVLSAAGVPTVDSDLFRWFDDPTFAALTHDSPLTRCAARLLGQRRIVLVEDQWFASAPGSRTTGPWHQDHPYYNLDRPFLTVWITLDDVPADVSLRVVPRSHSTGVLFAPAEFSANRSTIGAGSALQPVPDIDSNACDYPVLSWDLGAGDAVAIDSRLLHTTGRGVLPDRAFRRVSVRWASPATHYLDRGPEVARFWELLGHGLSDGDLIACDVFPIIEVTG